MFRKGETWNESELYRDPLTLRQVRRVTTQGLYNQTPTYHTNVGFTADGEFLIFGSARGGKSAIFRCHVPTGDITPLIEPVDGMGSYSALHKGNGVTVGNGMGVTGQMCIAPRSRWAVFLAGRALRAVHIETLEERMLIPDIGPEWVAGMPSIDPDETHVIVPVMSAHPEILAGRRPARSYMEHFATGEGMELRLLQVPLAGGTVTTIYREAGIGSAHCPHCPTDPDLLLLDRDFPPRYWAGSDGVTNRIWTLRLSTGELTELPPQDQARFQVHSAWTWDGQYVIYHGRSAEGGYYIGVVDRNGQTVCEYGFHQAEHYGHVSAMAGCPAIILDGNLSTDLLLWLYYDAEQPRVEIIARHGTDWGALPGQFPHPHPLSDPTGRWISFNAAHRGRSDVFIVAV
ncbi:MAG TPA: hypothetical protein G4O02_10455 [Caldilineae bacterium]|nr:hypothetical protein [Caldilineae bacterium]